MRKYQTARIVVTEQSNHDLIALFIAAFDRLTDKEKERAPSVVTR